MIDTSSMFTMLEVVIIIFIAILFGIIMGYMITYSNRISKFSKVDEIINTYQDIAENYYGEITEDDLANAAIKGMIDSLNDPFSSYLSEEENNNFKEVVDGSFVGIGVTIIFENTGNRIIDVYENSPAAKAGMQIDDILVEVNGIDVKTLPPSEVSNLVRGEKGSTVSITVKRGEKELTYEVKRDEIELKTVIGEIIPHENHQVGYLKISSFSSNTYKQFESTLKNLEERGIDRLVIDVRDNVGGHLLQTKKILSLFFPKKTVLYQIESKTKTQKVYSESKESREYPVAVLINSASASASEIVASCFQENYEKSVIIGLRSYGKGTVQKSQELSNGTSIKYTTEKWLTSKGVWLNGIGVTPTIEVSQTEEYYKEPIIEKDAQLQNALNQLDHF